ncbi:hypothetical protein EV191_101768 [Tamaricihabitans halophyticus]|uniref:LPXTG-motif cell wall-anchored protein n=1 Tax=Tamaricihabitans halophyticus TaxID=1262583 RepID=A0A4R2RAT3_9PSEU|nr:hypothetical protein [Tamaricihabitans halophyticus]TCP56821.1 hypothetical protein EV191_101768 [Tamaricihabitans halophyticus]
MSRRRRFRAGVALPLAAAVLALSAGAATAQPSTTPVPPPKNPDDPSPSQPAEPQPLGRAVADAGTGLAVLRLLPNSAPTKTILPDFDDQLPKQAAAELGFGMSSAQANSEAYLSYERSVAIASPMGMALQGSSPNTPGTLAQTALPDNPEPTTGGLNLPSTPLDAVIKAGLLNGKVHARWSEQLGPCVDTIADANTEIASLSLLNAIPTLPSFGGGENTPNLDQVLTEDAKKQAPEFVDGLDALDGPLDQLGGLLPGEGGAEGKPGSLLSLPNTLSSRSVVKLVDLPNSKNKAVQSTSTLQVAALKLLAGTPMELSINVVSQPTLRVTSTGSKDTSKVEYTAPILEVTQGGESLGKLDAANPKLDIPVGVPIGGGLEQLTEPLAGLPLVGSALNKLPGDQALDLGVLRLNIAGLDESSRNLDDPFKGFQLGATARLLDLQILPTDRLADLLPDLPSALAQVSLGEQVARAYAPEGGVQCGTKPAAPGGAPDKPQPQAAPAKQLAQTSTAYQAVPMFWTGTGMLFAGVVLLAALPRRRNE